MFTYTEERKIHTREATVTTTSAYPIPWTSGKASRPKDYYAQIRTVISYEDQGNKIEITIPAVEDESKNRKRVLKVRCNGKKIAFKKAARLLLNMEVTFDTVDMDALMQVVGANEGHGSIQEGVLRYCLPYFYCPEARYTLPAYKAGTSKMPPNGYIAQTHGDLKALVLPYLKAMQNPQYQGLRRELYIPVTTLGNSHHWNLVLLTLDADNQPAITYFETMTFSSSSNKQHYINLFKKNVLSPINKSLIQEGYPAIAPRQVLSSCLKQFSDRGCGFTVSMILEGLLTGNMQPAVVKLSDSLKEIPLVGIAEDAVRRLELALHLNNRERLIQSTQQEASEYRADFATHRVRLEAVQRQLKTSERSLRICIKEQSPQTDNPLDWSSLKKKLQTHLEQLQQRLTGLIQKADCDSAYLEVANAASELSKNLFAAQEQFFNKNDPSIAHLQSLQYDCGVAIAKARPCFEKHRGAWYQLAPLLRSFLGLLAGITLIPALAVELFTHKGYVGTFFQTPKTRSEVALHGFEEDITTTIGLK
jgi:hypothetical protein